MRLNEDNKISIYLYFVLLVSQSGMQLPFLHFMEGNNKYILAGLLLIAGLFFFYKKKRMPGLFLGMKFFWWLLIALVVSVVMAFIEWNQDFTTSILVYRYHLWLFFIPLFFYIRPSVHSISNALFAFAITSCIVCVGQMIGIFPIPVVETIWGDEMDTLNEFGGHGIVGVRLIAISLYLFLGEMATKYTKKNVFKVLVALTAVILSAQRAMMLFALPITAYVFLFKIKMSVTRKIAISFMFSIVAIVFFVNTGDIWLSLISQTTEQLGDKDYNRWLAVDFFINKYNKGTLPLFFGNGLLSLKNAGGRLLYELGYLGIYIDDIGMLGVWVRYGIIPFVVLYYIVVKVLLSKTMPLYLKLMCIHVGFLPTSWILLGPHYFVLILLIYLYCLNLPSKNYCRQRDVNNNVEQIF
ncbi:MAG: LPXTG cell wall anchor domain-containing protein [Paludibacteraceae bacterium]|nr:LPXTG cell wall anchor domain-containing protein [Lachnospiraceae bacterium]MBR5822702.1 LPXTG cell wall anchor domain-containing protein [Paludibacteraceae bacterium]